PQVADNERDVVDLSEDTRLPTPPVNVIQPLTHTKHMAHSFHSAHHKDTGEYAVAHCFMPGERELLDQLKDMETKRDDWRRTASEQKVAYSYHLTMDSLLKISPDILPSTTDDGTGPSTENNENNTTQLTSLRVQQAKAFALGAANKGEWEMPVWCRMFQQTLDGSARGWFDRLPNGCIDGYADLQEKFAERFALRRKCCKDPTESYVPPRPHNRRYDNQKQEVNHLNPDFFVKKPNEILATKLQLQLPSCPLMIETPKENLDRYCDYHREKRHYTNDCYQLKRQLEDALESEKLSHLIKDVRQRQSNKGRQSRNNNRKGKVINMREIGPYWEGGAKGGVRERRPLLKDDDESEKKKVVEEEKVKEMEPEEQTRPKEEKFLVNPVFLEQKVTIGTHFSKEFCFQLINLLK
nr:reverse transcriptase domain-containing protein [Tanacetum cinerariifolium]